MELNIVLIDVVDLSNTLTEALTAVFQRAQRSLVIVHNGRDGAGAGVIWQPGGIVVTNHHVVARGKARISLVGGREYPTRLIAKDPQIHLAILQAEDRGENNSLLPGALIPALRARRPGQGMPG